VAAARQKLLAEEVLIKVTGHLAGKE